MKNEATGFDRIVKALSFSVNGIKSCYQSETAFKQEVWATIVLVPTALWLTTSSIERALLITPIFIVLITEVVNTAIESVVDRIGSEHNELSGKAKDLGSAAVLFSLLLVIVTWSIILI
ncbi:MAG TPA: diacylglycerol kinase [Candidatus Thioglobus sp.]|jgi:diacylglycerol kinase (ATP)|nr:diacylglycerol kinase [Candidatus Thioglobus sp.]